MHAHQQGVDESGAGQKAPRNTAAKFYRVSREDDPDRAERVASLHERFVHRKKLRAAWDAEEARDLRTAYELRLWEECGCASLGEYLERFCGFTRREAIERIRVAMALADLPSLEDELEAARLSYSSVRELVRVVVAAKQGEWIEHCEGMTCDQVARAVSGHKRGDSPDDPVDPDEHRHRLVFEVRDSTRARFQAALRGLTRMRGHQFVDDDDQFQTITDILEWYAAGSSTTEGAAVAQNENAPTWTQEQTPPSSAPEAPPESTAPRPESKLDGATVAAMRNALSRPPVHVWLVSDGTGYAHGVELPKDELATLVCDSVEMGDIDDPSARVRKHLSGRERARTYALWGNQCAVPGCCSEFDLDIHHLVHLEDGGRDVPPNRLPLCKPHHRLHHAGKLKITGVAPYDVTFTFMTPMVADDS